MVLPPYVILPVLKYQRMSQVHANFLLQTAVDLCVQDAQRFVWLKEPIQTI